MCSAAGGAVAAGTGSVPTSIPVPAAEAAVAAGPSAVPTVTSGEEEATRVTAADAAVAVASSAVGGAVAEKWEAESLLACELLGGGRQQASGQIPDGMRQLWKGHDRRRRR